MSYSSYIFRFLANLGVKAWLDFIQASWKFLVVKILQTSYFASEIN